MKTFERLFLADGRENPGSGLMIALLILVLLILIIVFKT